MRSDDLARIRKGEALFPEHLLPADLSNAAFDDNTDLSNAILGTPEDGYVFVADVRWRGVNLAVVLLPPADQLGDEREARRARDDYNKSKSRETRLAEFRAAVRANRQLAVALKNQGMSEEAGRYAYRAQLLH